MAPHRGLQGTRESMRKVGNGMSRAGSGACSKQSGSDEMRIEAFVDWKRRVRAGSQMKE